MAGEREGREKGEREKCFPHPLADAKVEPLPEGSVDLRPQDPLGTKA